MTSSRTIESQHSPLPSTSQRQKAKKQPKTQSWSIISLTQQIFHNLRDNLLLIYYAYTHPDIPLAWRLYLLALLAYTLSPIDLIPDFIPVLGYLDDFLVVALGMALAVRFMPQKVYEDAQRLAKESKDKKIKKKPAMRFVVAAGIVLVYIVIGWFCFKKVGHVLYSIMYGRMERANEMVHLEEYYSSGEGMTIL